MSQANRLIINALSHYGQKAVLVGISLFLARFIVHNIGKEAYGLVVLAQSALVFLMLLQGGTGPALGRFVTHFYAIRNYAKMNKYYSTGQTILGAAGGLCLLFGLAVTWQFPVLFTVPSGLEAESRWVVFFITVTSAMTLGFSTLSVGFHATQRYDIENLIVSAKEVLRALLIVGSFLMLRPSALVVAVITFISILFMTAMRYVAVKRVMPELQLFRFSFEPRIFNDTWRFSFFAFMAGLSYVIHINAANLVINKMLGPAAVASFALASVWGNQISSLVDGISTITTPAVTTLQTADDSMRIREILVRGTKYALMLSLPACLLLSLFAGPIISVWLGPGYDEVAWLMPFILLPKVFSLSQSVSYSVLTGLGHVRFPAVVSIIGALASVALSVVLIGMFEYGVLGAALALAVSYIIRNGLIIPVYACNKTGLRLMEYLRRSIFNVLMAMMPSLLFSLGMFHYSMPQTLVPTTLTLIAAAVLFCVGCYFLCLDDYEKRKIIEIGGIFMRKVESIIRISS